VALANIIQLSNSDGPGPPTRAKMGGQQALFDNFGMRPLRYSIFKDL